MARKEVVAEKKGRRLFQTKAKATKWMKEDKKKWEQAGVRRRYDIVFDGPTQQWAVNIFQFEQ